MPFELYVEKPPAGFAMRSARPDEYVQICFREFTSTEDGQYFIQRLERSASEILQSLPAKISPSNVDHMLAIYDRNCRRSGFRS